MGFIRDTIAVCLLYGFPLFLFAQQGIPADVMDAYSRAQYYLYVNEDSCACFCDEVYDYAVRYHNTELEADVLLLKAETLF